MLLALCSNFKKEVCAKEELISVLGKKKIDVLLTLGAGDIGNLVQPIKNMLNWWKDYLLYLNGHLFLVY